MCCYSGVPALCLLLHWSWLYDLVESWVLWQFTSGWSWDPKTAYFLNCCPFEMSMILLFIFFLLRCWFFPYLLCWLLSLSNSKDYSILQLCAVPLFSVLIFFCTHIGFKAIYMLVTLKFISIVKTFLQTPPTHPSTGHSHWISFKDFKFLKTV